MFWAAIGRCTSHRGSNRTSVSSSVNRLSRVILSPSCKPSIPTVKPGVEVLQHEANSGTLMIHPNYSSNTRPTFAFLQETFFSLSEKVHSLVVALLHFSWCLWSFVATRRGAETGLKSFSGDESANSASVNFVSVNSVSANSISVNWINTDTNCVTLVSANFVSVNSVSVNSASVNLVSVSVTISSWKTSRCDTVCSFPCSRSTLCCVMCQKKYKITTQKTVGLCAKYTGV